MPRASRTKKAAEVVALRPAPTSAGPMPAPDEVAKTFASFASQLVRAAEGADTERALLSAILRLLKARACFVVRPHPERALLQVKTVRGRADARIAAVTPGQGPVGRAYSCRRIVREEGLIAAPLQANGDIDGCLVVLDPRHFASDELLTALAAHVSALARAGQLGDIARRRQKDLETAVAGLKRLERAREELLANVSHDLKNPLTAIKTCLSLLGRGNLGKLTEKQHKAVAMCDRNADRLLRLINDLLLMSRLQAGNMRLSDRPFGLKAVAEEAIALLAPLAEGARVSVHLSPSPEFFVRGDRARLVEAVFHLLENAVHRSPADGHVEVRIAGGGKLVSLSVADAGPAFDEEDLPHLFDAYFRPSSSPRPAGLSLAVASRIIHLHGGRISAEKSERGTEVQVHLPMFAGAVAAAEQSRSPECGCILLVEDDADCREVLAQLLELEGYRVVCCASARKARETLERVRPALVLLDLKLSEEDGMSVLHQIRNTPELADVAVYVISGAREVAALSYGTGPDRIDGFFEKPLQVAQVLDTVAKVVRPARTGGGRI